MHPDQASSCLGKITYASLPEAWRTLRRMRKINNRHQRERPYRCRWCRQVHLGNTRWGGLCHEKDKLR